MANFKSYDEVLTKKFLSDWLGTAIYQNFWCTCGTHPDTSKEIHDKAKEESNYAEDRWASVLLLGGALIVIDIEEWDEEDENNTEGEHKVTLEDIKKALPLFTLNYPTQWAAIIDETMDLYDADALLQFVVFGDVIYG